MRHLWTTATTGHTVTHDAGEPEWLDLPVQGFVIEGDLPDERPVVKELNPPWHVLTCWQLEPEDVGQALFADLEIRGPTNFMLHFTPLKMPDGGEFLYVDVFRPTTLILPYELDEIMYTVDGVYTVTVEWTGSVATRDRGEFALHIAHYGD